ncbi:MAG: hypothetical protein ACR2N6_07930 [Miltoncostaeaceae bacterium]
MRLSDDRSELPPLVNDLAPLMEAEIERARRLDRPVALLSVPMEAVPPGGPTARAYDMVAVSPEDRCFVMLLPETTRFQARRMALRLSVHGEDASRVATFPDDAASFADLLARVARADA